MYNMSDSRTKILNALKSTTLYVPSLEHIRLDDIFVQPEGDLAIEFQKQLNSISGECFIVDNEYSAVEKIGELSMLKSWKNISVASSHILECINSSETLKKLEQISSPEFSEVSITYCESLIARTGSVLVSTAIDTNRRSFAAPDVHVVIGYTSQLVADLNSALCNVKQKYGNTFPSQITLITGPSRTADIEKTLILGAHGPKEFIVLLIRN